MLDDPSDHGYVVDQVEHLGREQLVLAATRGARWPGYKELVSKSFQIKEAAYLGRVWQGAREERELWVSQLKGKKLNLNHVHWKSLIIPWRRVTIQTSIARIDTTGSAQLLGESENNQLFVLEKKKTFLLEKISAGIYFQQKGARTDAEKAQIIRLQYNLLN